MRDHKPSEGQNTIILITDGEETCDGDPAESIEFLKAEGFDIRVNIVGSAIDDDTLKRDFQEWAELGGGLYFDASSEEEVRAAPERAVMPNFRVIDAAGTLVAEGTAGGDPVTLALDPPR